MRAGHDLVVVKIGSSTLVKKDGSVDHDYIRGLCNQVSDLKQLFAYTGCDAGIRAMALSYDQR